MIQNNTTYYLITTGLNIDPKNGSFAECLYTSIKSTIQKKATINYEHTIRGYDAVSANSFLQTYNTDPRGIYQYLFGVESHSNTWTIADLSNELSLYTYSYNPNNGEYAIDFPNMYEAGFSVYKNISGSWTEQKIYYSYGNLTYYYGNDDDITLNVNNNTVQFLAKKNGTWQNLYNIDNVIVQPTTPAIQSGYWIKNSAFILNKFNDGYYFPSSAVSFSLSSPSEALVYINATIPNWTFEIYHSGVWNRINLSNYPVQQKSSNSWFNNSSGNNNFIIHEGDEALSGGPIHVSFMNNQVYDIGITFDSLPGDGQTLIRYPFPSNVSFPIDFQGSKAVAGVLPTSVATFIIQKNGDDVGTIEYNASLNGIFNSNNESITFNKGDIMTIICPSPQDATLSSIGFSIQGLRF